MKRLAVVMLTGLLALPAASAAASSTTFDPHHATPFSDAPEAVESADTAARAQDLALVAEARGWTLEQAKQQREVSERLAVLTTQLATERPDIYIGGALANEPGNPPTLLVKGPPDDQVLALVARSGLSLILADRQPYSLERYADYS